ncbi:endonuclease/exonuclease/phosphatase family protein [Nocardia sp. NPDC059177]|uniref:endonuclease/exonuclease/phosphatase family protein n=1 Tax=Nocardia sp. NPDC059177 TaxID=3346759 RepID=UPI0036ACD4BA
MRTRRSPRTLAFAGVAALCTAALLGYGVVPGGLGVVLAIAAPWLGIPVALLALVALVCRCPGGVAALVIPLLAWAQLFGAWVAPAVRAAPEPGQIRVVTQNLFAANGSPAATAHALAATGADLIGVQELTGESRDEVRRVLDAAYPHRTEVGTVALWSRYPITGTSVADVGLDWDRGLRAQVRIPDGELAVYVVHLPSIRPWDTGTRDRGLSTLSRQLDADPAARVIVAGDFNTASTDRNWPGFAPGYQRTLDIAAPGANFTWPAALPLTRLDHILVRGFAVGTASVLRLPGPDHRAVAARLTPV